MPILTFQQWLEVPNKSLWTYVEDKPGCFRCTGFGATFKQVFSNMGMQILTAHKYFKVHGNLENSILIDTNTNNVTIPEDKSVEGLDLTIGVKKDVEAYLNMFNRVCSENRPKWNLNNLDLPPDVWYFRRVNVLFKKLPMRCTYKQMRYAEFWIFNYPGFIDLGLHFNFFHIIFEAMTTDELYFKYNVTLTSGQIPDILNGWANKRFEDKEGYLDRIFNYIVPPTGLIHQSYSTRQGIINFVHNVHHNDENPSPGNRLHIAEKIQSIYPDLMGMIHLELSQKYKTWREDLIDLLVQDQGGVHSTYTWG